MKKLIFFGLLIGLFLKLFVFDFLKISGKSMEPTLSSGNHIVINKAAYGIQNPFSKEYKQLLACCSCHIIEQKQAISWISTQNIVSLRMIKDKDQRGS